jgi:hypothetical protein
LQPTDAGIAMTAPQDGWQHVPWLEPLVEDRATLDEGWLTSWKGATHPERHSIRLDVPLGVPTVHSRECVLQVLAREAAQRIFDVAYTNC